MIKIHFHIGFFEFLIFGLYLIIWNAIFQFLNLETRRGSGSVSKTAAGVFGMHS